MAIQTQINETVSTVLYPGAAVLKEACLQEYLSQKETNSKLYDKINLALAFCGIVFFEYVKLTDFQKLIAIDAPFTTQKIIIIVLYLMFVISSFGIFVFTLISLITLAKGKRLAVFDTNLCRQDSLYRAEPDRAELLLIETYTKIIAENRPVIEDKQVKFNAALSKLVISIILFILVFFMQANYL